MTFKSPYVVGVIYTAVYIVFSLIVFGNVYSPIGYIMFWEYIRLPRDILIMSYGFGAVSGIIIYLLLNKTKLFRAYKFGAIILSFVSASIFMAAFLSGRVQTEKIVKLQPEKIITNSFVKSLHNTPREFQFYTHAVAIKNCQTYAWSYRDLEFYELKDSVSKNVVPRDWLKDCNRAPTQQ